MALSCIVCEIQQVIGRKSRNLYTPPVFSAPAGVTPLGITRRCLIIIIIIIIIIFLLIKVQEYAQVIGQVKTNGTARLTWALTAALKTIQSLYKLE